MNLEARSTEMEFSPLIHSYGVLSFCTEIHSYGVLSFCFLFYLTISKTMLKRMYANHLPNLIPITEPTHHYFTRERDRLRIPLCPQNFLTHGIDVVGPRVWNSLPISLRSINSFSLFIKRCRLWLLEENFICLSYYM